MTEHLGRMRRLRHGERDTKGIKLLAHLEPVRSAGVLDYEDEEFVESIDRYVFAGYQLTPKQLYRLEQTASKYQQSATT